jgi:hypothetical protein
MTIQYFIFAIIITLVLFLIAMGIQKTTKIFVGNYIAGFSAMISYLFLDVFSNYIDGHYKTINIQNPDAVLQFITMNKIWIVIIIYFIFLTLFYKSRLFEIQVQWILKKIIGYIFLPSLTVINLLFTMLLLINWPTVLTYDGYMKAVNNFHITNYYLQNFFNFIPFIIIFVPIFVLLIFLEVHIKLPSLRKKPKEEKHIEQTEEEHMKHGE